MSLRLNSWFVHNIAQHLGDEVWKGLKVVIPPIPNYPTSKDMTNFAKNLKLALLAVGRNRVWRLSF